MQIFSSYSGPDFLAFYVVMLVTCIFLGLWIPANLRETGRKGRVDDLEEIAVLSGGAERHTTAVMTDIFAGGGLAESGKHKLRVARTELNVGDAGRALLRKVGDFKLSEAKKTLKSHALGVEGRLIRRGLMMRQEERNRLRFFSVLPYIALFALGLYRQQAGEELGEPTGFLVGLLILTAAFGIIRIATGNPRTMAGNAALRDLEKTSSRMKRAPSATEAGYAVAIFGTAVLVGTPWEPVHAMRQAANSGDAGSSGGDGDGGGGCGGGCGGCGG